MKLFFVDPGTKSTGWAYYEDGNLRNSGFIEADDNEADPLKRSEYISLELLLLIKECEPVKIVCEKPLKRGPGHRSGHIYVLVHFCGMIHGLASYFGIPFEYVEVSAWKGNIDKKIHQPRIVRDCLKKYDIDITGHNSDQIDAIGLGMWYVVNN